MHCLFPRKFPDVQCVVTTITDKVVEFVLPGNEKGIVLLSQTLREAGVTEGEYFSLQYVDRHKKWQWFRHQKPIYPQWKDSIADRHSVTITSIPVFNLRVRVKFYPNDPCRVADVIARYHLFLQVRANIASRQLTMPEDLFVELCGMILQSDLGDTPVPDLGHIDARLAMDLTPALRQRIFQAHAIMRGREPDAVEYMFLDKVKWLDGYGSICTEVQDDKRNPCLFCLKPTSVYVEKNGRKFINAFWPSVTGFAVRKTALLMKVKDRNVSLHCFYLSSKEDARALWKLSEEHHAFFRKNFEIRLMRSSSSAASVTRHLTRSSANYDEEARLTSRSSGSRKAFSDTNDTSSVLSSPLLNGGNNSSANTSPALRRSSLVSDRGMSTRRASDHDVMASASAHPRTRAVHLSDVESDSYMSRRPRPYRDVSDYSGNGAASDSQRANGATAAASYEPSRNGLHGSLHSLQSDPTGGPQGYRRARRRRSRPNSPPGKAGPPPELLDHIMFEPIEPPADLSEAQRHDIAYTVVETNAEPFRVRYSPRMKQRGRSWLKPPPPPTEILPHASAPVLDAQSDIGMPAPVVGGTVRPLPTRPSAVAAYTPRTVLSPVEAINCYADTLRAKQKDLMMRGGMYNSPKVPARHQQHQHQQQQQHQHQHQQQQQQPQQQRSAPQFCFMATGHDLSLMTPPKRLHNASYSAAVHDHSYQHQAGPPDAAAQQMYHRNGQTNAVHRRETPAQRMTLL